MDADRPPNTLNDANVAKSCTDADTDQKTVPAASNSRHFGFTRTRSVDTSPPRPKNLRRRRTQRTQHSQLDTPRDDTKRDSQQDARRDNNHGWTRRLERQTTQWLLTARSNAALYESAAIGYSRRYKYAQAALAVLTVLVGSRGLQELTSADATPMDIAVAVCQLLLGIIASLSTSFDWRGKERACMHQASQFSKLGTLLLTQLTLPRGERMQNGVFLRVAGARIDALQERELVLPGRQGYHAGPGGLGSSVGGDVGGPHLGHVRVAALPTMATGITGVTRDTHLEYGRALEVEAAPAAVTTRVDAPQSTGDPMDFAIFVGSEATTTAFRQTRRGRRGVRTTGTSTESLGHSATSEASHASEASKHSETSANEATHGVHSPPGWKFGLS